MAGWIMQLSLAQSESRRKWAFSFFLKSDSARMNSTIAVTSLFPAVSLILAASLFPLASCPSLLCVSSRVLASMHASSGQRKEWSHDKAKECTHSYEWKKRIQAFKKQQRGLWRKRGWRWRQSRRWYSSLFLLRNQRNTVRGKKCRGSKELPINIITEEENEDDH